VDREGELALCDQVENWNADVKGCSADPLLGQTQLLNRRRDGDSVATTTREHELYVLVALVPRLDRSQRGAFGGADADLDEVDACRLEDACSAVHARLLVEGARNADHA